MILSKETKDKIASCNMYWKEILERDEPRRSSCCAGELSSVISMLTPLEIMNLMHLGANSLEK